MSDKSARMKWSNEEWAKVAVNMLPLLERGVPRATALERAQKLCLPPERRRDKASATHTAAPSNNSFNKFVEAARLLSEEERAAKLVPIPVRKPPPPRKRLDDGRDYQGGVRWTTLEKAKIARMVLWFQDHGVKSTLGRMIVEAQELVLTRERRRAPAGIMQGNHSGQNKIAFEDGKNNLWLLKDVPFNPPRPPGSEPEPVEEVEQAQEATETAQEATNGPEPVQTQPEVAPLALPPVAGGTIREAMTAAVAQFGDTLRGAMDALLLQQTALVIHQMESRMLEQASRTAREVAALIEGQLRKSVHNMVEQELGGPISAPSPDGKAAATPVYASPSPAPEASPVAAPTPAAAPRARQLKVDVVGLNTSDLEQRVRRGFGPEVDLRFWNPDSAGSYTPHRGRECIMVIQRVPHTLRHKVKAAGVEPLYVKATEGHVIHAIEELQRAHTVAQAAHNH